MKKLVVLLLFIFLLFGFYLIISRKPHNYEITYKLNEYDIKENYNVNNNIYTFDIGTKEDNYIFNIKSEYFTKRKLVTNVSKKDNCITIDSVLLSNYTICKKDGKYFSNFYDAKLTNKKSDTFEGIDIYELGSHTYFVWNYNKMLALKNKNLSKIELFNSDVYNIDLYYLLDQYLIIPNYDEKYSFSSLYMINSKNYKTSKIYLNIDLYYDSYFLGDYDDDIYIYDLKKEQEYRINPFKKNIYKNKYEYYDNGKWYDTTRKALNDKKIFFNQTKEFYFDVENNLLIYNTPAYKINVSNIKVDYLISSNEKNAFFLSNGILYYVNIYNDITKVLGYKEWNYNQGNVFIF